MQQEGQSGLRLDRHWSIFESCGESRPPILIKAGCWGAVLQGAVSCTWTLQPGTHPLGRLAETDNVKSRCIHPWAPIRVCVLAAPERPDRQDLPKYDRPAMVEVSVDGEVTVSQEDGVIARLQLGSIAWLCTKQHLLHLSLQFEKGNTPQNVCCRRAGPLVFCEGILPCLDCSQSEDLDLAVLPPECRPHGGRRCYLAVCNRGGLVHVLRVLLQGNGQLSVRRSHTQGRARDGHLYDAPMRHVGALEVSLACVRFTAEIGLPLTLLNGSRAPRQHAARKHLAYLGLQAEKSVGDTG